MARNILHSKQIRSILTVTLCILLLGSASFLFRSSDAGAATLGGKDVRASTQTLSALLKPDGTLDLSSGFSGSVDTSGYTMHTTPDGEPQFSPVAPQAAGDERWNSRFGLPGIPEARLSAMTVASNGDVYVGGTFDDIDDLTVNHIARWDGTHWFALGTGLTMAPLGEVHQIVLNGADVYVVGEFTRAGGTTANQIARWNGNAWGRIGSGVGPRLDDGEDAYIYTLAFVGNDLYVGGRFTRMDNVAANNLARWNGNAWAALGRGIGSLDFNDEFSADATVYALLGNGSRLLVGGEFNFANQLRANAIAVLNNGSWTTFGEGIASTNFFQPGSVRAIAVSGANVFAGGRFELAGGEEVNNIAYWNGTRWNAMDLGVTNDGFALPVATLAVKGNELFVGGGFTDAGGEARQGIATWNIASRTWRDAGPAIANRFDEDARVEEVAVAPDGSVLVGGTFELAGTLFVNNIARLMGSDWHVLGDGVGDSSNNMSGTIRAMAVDSAGRVYVGGRFVYAGGVPVTNLAMWDGDSWSNIGNTNDNATIRALLVAGNTLYAAGDFTAIGDVAVQNIAQRNLATGTWSSVGDGINGQVNALAFSDGILYAGGDFTAAGDVTAYDVAYWNGSRWSSFGNTLRIFEIGDAGTEVGTLVYALAVKGNTVIVGGYFQTLHLIGTNEQNLENYRLVNNVVGWQRTSDTWFYVGNLTDTEEPGVTTDGFSGFGTEVTALAIDGSDVYIGGTFNKAGTAAAANIVKWSTARQQWSTLRSGMGGEGDPLNPTQVWAMTMRGSDLYVAGHFTTAGTTGARFVARYETRTNTWANLGSGLRWYNDRFTYAYALALAPQTVYVGGVFSGAGEGPSVGFAQWTPEQVTPQPTATGTIVVPGSPPDDTYNVYLPLIRK